jgi:hypothetical protein
MLCFFAAGAARGQNIIYNNSTNDTGFRFNPGLVEVGDEIVLGGRTDFRRVTNFTFEYYGLNFSGDEKAQIRFYANNGTNSTAGPQVPNTLLYDSGQFPIAATARATLSFDLATLNLFTNNLTVPNDFTWSVQFFLGTNAPSSTEDAGVDLYSPPTVGNNFNDYWEQSASGWTLKTNGFLNMNFAAVVSAVPEPSALVLFALSSAGFGLAVLRRRNRR